MINNIEKIVRDTQNNIVGTYINAVEFENKNPYGIELDELISIKGEHWRFIEGQNRYLYTNRALGGGSSIVYLELKPAKKKLLIYVFCRFFRGEKLRNMCLEKFPNNGTNQNYYNEIYLE